MSTDNTSAPTILGCPVIDGRAVTPMGAVTLHAAGPGANVGWTLHPQTPKRDWPTEAEAIADADRVLSALRDAARADLVAEVAALKREVHRLVSGEEIEGDGLCEHEIAADDRVAAAERRGRVAGLREAATEAREHDREAEPDIKGGPLEALADALTQRADNIERGEPVSPQVGDLVIWARRTTLVRVVDVQGDLVTTAGRPGVGPMTETAALIRFCLRADSAPHVGLWPEGLA